MHMNTKTDIINHNNNKSIIDINLSPLWYFTTQNNINNDFPRKTYQETIIFSSQFV